MGVVKSRGTPVGFPRDLINLFLSPVVTGVLLQLSHGSGIHFLGRPAGNDHSSQQRHCPAARIYFNN